MIEQNNPNIGIETCFDCNKDIKINEPHYVIADMTGASVRVFPNGKNKLIVFCHPCWKSIAGKKYAFSEEMPLPKDLVYDLLNEVINKIPFKP